MTSSKNHSTPEPWRLIIHPPQSGARNMAIDEAILDNVESGNAPPTLRLYAWEPACLSLGYAQRSRDVDRMRIESLGWQVVRRMTGGRAILHTDELTYSVTLPLDHPLAAGGIMESYQRLSRALLSGVNAIGLSASADKQADRSPERPGAVCFELPSDYEITAGGRKLIGSAQVRHRGAMLQHGTLPLSGDVTRICEALSFADQEARIENQARVRERATTLADALGRDVSWTEAADAVIAAFADQFALRFEQADLSPAEFAGALELADTRYSSESWTFRT